ncbi:CRISPR-associated endonuclease Cas2 [Succinimonas sp.]|uniref:CRISPR-associated endonuclease Cas2 n=1 Tax=Succinimonas sp. TaxID=1936151 RepID=UPI00386336C2
MRIILFFDLPMVTKEDVRRYNRFHKFLIKEGFIMIQYSVYAKLALNKSIISQVKKRLDKNKPPNGSIAILEITEKQFAGIQWILGQKSSYVLDTTDKVTIYNE